MRLGVVVHHERNVEFVKAFASQGGTNHTRGMTNKERDVLGSSCLGRHDEVALVLTVLIIYNHDDLAPSHSCNGVLNRGKHGVFLSLFG